MVLAAISRRSLVFAGVCVGLAVRRTGIVEESGLSVARTGGREETREEVSCLGGIMKIVEGIKEVGLMKTTLWMIPGQCRRIVGVVSRTIFPEIAGSFVDLAVLTIGTVKVPGPSAWIFQVEIMGTMEVNLEVLGGMTIAEVKVMRKTLDKKTAQEAWQASQAKESLKATLI